jgi:hypothetical protein
VQVLHDLLQRGNGGVFAKQASDRSNGTPLRSKAASSM